MSFTFKFEINEKVFIKGDWENVYTVYKINGRKYQLKTQDWYTWRNDSELTNSRKSDFLKSLRENKKVVEENKKVVEENKKVVIKDVYKYINWKVKNRPCKFLFINEKDSPKQVFYWQEEDYDGSIFVVYEYLFENNLFYLCLNSRFGSCSGCDGWENILEMDCNENKEDLGIEKLKKNYIEREYKNIYIELSKNDIKHEHPECNKKLINWKKNK